MLRKAGEGEGVLASSWMTGMILLVVRRVEWSLSSSTEVTRPDSGARDPWQPEPDKYWEWSLQANDKLGVTVTLHHRSPRPEERIPPAGGENSGVAGVVASQGDGVPGRVTTGVIVLNVPGNENENENDID